MCKSPLHDLLVALPKCEHHMHLEGSLSPELLFELAAKNNVTLPQDDPAFASVEALYARYERFTSLNDFLHYYYIGFTVLSTASDFEALAFAYLTRAHAAAVRHTELFFDPQVHLARHIPLTTILPSIARAQRRALAAWGLTSLVVPCLLRHTPVADAAAAFGALVENGWFARGAVAGLGLCSSETAFPPGRWRDIFGAARRLGIRRTVHAGEEGPAGYVVAALDELHAQRIDHGVRAAEDAGVVKRLAEEGVMLTVCPMSNVRLKGVKTLGEVPIRVFLDTGVAFSINSDDPAYFGGYIQENYCAVEEAFGLSEGEWEGIARNAVKGSWCDEPRKEEILREITDVLAEWKAKRIAAETVSA